MHHIGRESTGHTEITHTIPSPLLSTVHPPQRKQISLLCSCIFVTDNHPHTQALLNPYSNNYNAGYVAIFHHYMACNVLGNTK